MMAAAMHWGSIFCTLRFGPVLCSAYQMPLATLALLIDSLALTSASAADACTCIILEVFQVPWFACCCAHVPLCRVLTTQLKLLSGPLALKADAKPLRPPVLTSAKLENSFPVVSLNSNAAPVPCSPIAGRHKIRWFSASMCVTVIGSTWTRQSARVGALKNVWQASSIWCMAETPVNRRRTATLYIRKAVW